METAQREPAIVSSTYVNSRSSKSLIYNSIITVISEGGLRSGVLLCGLFSFQVCKARTIQYNPHPDLQMATFSHKYLIPIDADGVFRQGQES